MMRICREFPAMTFQSRLFFGVLLLALLPLAQAEEPRQLTWANLVPASAVTENPFLELSRDQLTWISDVAAVRDRQARGDTTVTPAEIQTARNLSEKLEQAGVDVDGLLAQRAVIARRGQEVDQTLDGKLVRIPGYLLPLEFSGRKVSEFLLVPWVGACIHTPPPPPNQIVHVRTEQGYTTDGGLYTPVWVSGTMKTEQRTSSLELVDGASDIPSSYLLEATSIKPYE